MLLSDDGTSTDLGYPSTVELDDPGHLLTTWYELLDSPAGDLPHYNTRGRDEAWFKVTCDKPGAVLRQATWRLSS